MAMRYRLSGVHRTRCLRGRRDDSMIVGPVIDDTPSGIRQSSMDRKEIMLICQDSNAVLDNSGED